MVEVKKELNYNTTVECRKCERAFEIFMDYDDYQAWLKGKSIYQAMPYMPEWAKRLMATRECPICLGTMTEEEFLAAGEDPVINDDEETGDVEDVEVVLPAPKRTRILITKKGRSVETPYSDQEAIDRLVALKLPSNFAQDLVAKRRNLKGDQIIWVHILVVEAEEKAAGKDNRPKAQIGDMQKIIDMFNAAKQHIERPKIRLSINGQEIRLSVATKLSKYPGSIQVVRAGDVEVGGFKRVPMRGDYARREWLGRINTDGTFVQAKDRVIPGLAELLKRFAENPLAVAMEYGKMMGHCCFCGKPLTDNRSVEAGYGPICADHFGLAWGN